MRTRRTHDYSPTKKGSKEEQAAINARREMLNLMTSQPVEQEKPDKWTIRMLKKAKGFTIG